MQTDPYRRIAGWYDRVMGPLNGALPAIGLALEPVEPGAAVLDVGCGTGSFLAAYVAAGCRGFGIDASPAMLERAERRLGGRADLRLGDATRLPYEDDSFELVLAATLLHELDEPARGAALAEMARAVKPGGRVLVVDYGTDPLRIKGLVMRWLSLLPERAAGRTHFRNFRSFLAAGGLPALLGDAGLAVERVRMVAGGNLGLFLLRPTADT